MTKRQMTLSLDAETEAEAEEVWGCLPLGSREEIAEHYARLIGRAAKVAASRRERKADDEHSEPSD